MSTDTLTPVIDELRRIHARLGEPTLDMLRAYRDGTLPTRERLDLEILLKMRPELRAELEVLAEPLAPWTPPTDTYTKLPLPPWERPDTSRDLTAISLIEVKSHRLEVVTWDLGPGLAQVDVFVRARKKAELNQLVASVRLRLEQAKWAHEAISDIWGDRATAEAHGLMVAAEIYGVTLATHAPGVGVTLPAHTWKTVLAAFIAASGSTHT